MRNLSLRAQRVLLAAAAGFGLASTVHAGDYYIDPNYAGVEGQPYNGYVAAYKNIATALGSTGMPAGTQASPNRLIFAPGTYNTASTTGVSLSNSRSDIALVNLSGNPDDVVITSTLDSTYNPGSGALGTTGSSTLQLKGNRVSAYGITFANSTDTPYIQNVGHQAVSPQGNYATGQAQTANSPCVALLLQGDQQAFRNCKVLGYQDSLYTKGGRSFFTNSTVSGDVDFIFANGTTVFKDSTINLDSDHVGGTITAASTDKRQSNGLVFLSSKVTGNSMKNNPVIDPLSAGNANPTASKSMYLGRPYGWQQVGADAGTVFVNTQIAGVIKDAGWLAWNTNETIAGNAKNNGDPSEDSRYAEYNTTDLSGNPTDVSARVAWSHQLTASQAAAYTELNVLASEGTFPWFGAGYAGSANPASPNYSWPAFWGNRNAQNDTNNAAVLGNPTAYSNPNWTLGGDWNPYSQLALVPEPCGLSLIGGAGLLLLKRRAR